MKTRPFKGNDNNEPLRKRSHKAASRREHKLRNGNSWQGLGPYPYKDNVETEQSALPTTCNSVDEMSDDAFKDMMTTFAAENFGSMLNRHGNNFGTVTIKNKHSNNNKGHVLIKPDVRMSRRKRTMAACLCRHMKDVLFSDTTVTMAEKDRKSYFKTTRRLLGKCSYAQNLALFYILYVRKKVNCTAESLSTQCAPRNASVTKTNTTNILLCGAGDDHGHNHHHLPHHLYGYTLYTPDTDHPRHHHHRTNTNTNTLKKIGDSEESKVRLQKFKFPKPTAPTVDETLAEDLFITHNMRTIKIKENGQIEHNLGTYKEEREVKGAAAAPERRVNPGAFRFTLPAPPAPTSAPAPAPAKQTHQNHHNHNHTTCILVNERPPCTVSKHIKISTANSPHKSSKKELRKLLVRRKHKIKHDATARNKLERTMSRAADLVRIGKQMRKLGHLRRRRRRKSRKNRRRKSKGASSKMPHRDPCGNLTKAENSGNLANTENSEGFVPPTGRSWTRPGWYLEAAPLHPAPRGRRAGRPAGPGLPNGDETGDDD